MVKTEIQTFDCMLLAMKSSAACFDSWRLSRILSNTIVTRLTWRFGSGCKPAGTGSGDAVVADLAFDQPERRQIARHAVLGDLHFVGPQIADRIPLLVAHDDVEQDDGALCLEAWASSAARRRSAARRSGIAATAQDGGD